MSDEELRHQIDEIFRVFDRDHSQTLDFGELNNFFQELFKRMNINRQISQEEIINAMR